jgi:hypothetical protein
VPRLVARLVVSFFAYPSDRVTRLFARLIVNYFSYLSDRVPRLARLVVDLAPSR